MLLYVCMSVSLYVYNSMVQLEKFMETQYNCLKKVEAKTDTVDRIQNIKKISRVYFET